MLFQAAFKITRCEFEFIGILAWSGSWADRFENAQEAWGRDAEYQEVDFGELWSARLPVVTYTVV